MIGHELAHVTQEAHHVTAHCECGATYQHPDRAGAIKRHAGHVWFQEQRQALKGERS